MSEPSESNTTAGASGPVQDQRYRAVLLSRVGGPEVLRVVDMPLLQPGPKQLRVRIRAAGVGSTDPMMLDGRYSYAPPTPFVPGYEIAGGGRRYRSRGAEFPDRPARRRTDAARRVCRVHRP